jgi:benzoate/toluate 1,2-dioxygenase alpha subunit
MIPIHIAKQPGQPDLSLDAFLIEDHAQGDYRLHRSAFTDPALFDLEMKHIFEGNWIYLAHESQIPNNNDYYTTHISRSSSPVTARES